MSLTDKGHWKAITQLYNFYSHIIQLGKMSFLLYWLLILLWLCLIRLTEFCQWFKKSKLQWVTGVSSQRRKRGFSSDIGFPFVGCQSLQQDQRQQTRILSFGRKKSGGKEDGEIYGLRYHKNYAVQLLISHMSNQMGESTYPMSLSWLTADWGQTEGLLCPFWFSLPHHVFFQWLQGLGN